MEVTLKDAAIDCYHESFAQTVRREDSQEAVVPDTLPDIGGILCTSGNVLIRGKDVGEGRVRIEANIPARVAYTPEEGDGVCAMDVDIPLYLTLEEESIQEESFCVADLSLASLETRILNPRKISVRAETVCALRCFTPGSMSFLGAPEEAVEGIHFLERQVTMSPVSCVTEKTFVLTDEFEVPEGTTPAELLSQQIRVQTEDVKTVGNKLIVKGVARSSLLYRSTENTPGAVEFTTSFSQVVDCDSLPPEPHVFITTLPSGVYYDLLGGDGRRGSAEIHLVIQAEVRGENSFSYVKDVYSNSHPLETAKEQREVCRALRSVNLRETGREILELPEAPGELLQASYELGEPKVEGNTVLIPAFTCVWYCSGEGETRVLHRTLRVELHADLAEGQCLRIISVNPQELSAVVSGNTVELRLPVEVCALIFALDKVECVTSVTYDDSLVDIAERPSLVLLRARSEDDLWTLAKENCSTVKAIREANDLDSLPQPWERLLLIPKTV